MYCCRGGALTVCPVPKAPLYSGILDPWCVKVSPGHDVSLNLQAVVCNL